MAKHNKQTLMDLVEVVRNFFEQIGYTVGKPNFYFEKPEEGSAFVLRIPMKYNPKKGVPRA